MDASQILQANFLDIVFENRNKQYGAYELRKNYGRRTFKALAISLGGVLLIITFAAFKPEKEIIKTEIGHMVVMENIDEIPKPIIETPPPVQQQTPPPVRTERYVVPIITPDDQVVEPVTKISDLEDAKISTIQSDGPVDDNIAPTAVMNDGDGKDIIEVKKKPEEPATNVQVQASFKGNWMRFLENNLRGEVPVENGAPAGNHKVLIQFVVDLDGSISQITPLTTAGYGMEQEAIRVIKKAGNWSPAIQDGMPVKAYRVQSITFQIAEN